MLLSAILAIGLVAVVIAEPSIVEVGPGADLPNTLDVSADGTASADPDVADIFITVETTAETADEAQSQNAEQVSRLRLALVGTGLVEEVTTTSFNLYPSYGYYYGAYAGAEPAAVAESGVALYQPPSSGYTVTHNLKVHSESVNGAGKIIDVAVANGATRVDYVQFSLSDDKAEDLKQQALRNAAAKAKDKAQVLASAASVSLGKPLHISESSYFYPPVYYGREAYAFAGVAEAPTQVTPGEIEVSATVSISYEIA
jgi:hypothetical protein